MHCLNASQVWVPSLSLESIASRLDMSKCREWHILWFACVHTHVRRDILCGHLRIHCRRLDWQYVCRRSNGPLGSTGGFEIKCCHDCCWGTTDGCIIFGCCAVDW